MEVSHQSIQAFLETLWKQYRLHGRPDLPWRQPEPDGNFDPYKILVSELMLQQTQVARVIPKYRAFIRRFPDTAALAEASLGDVLRAWQGLGYNRRAKFLWQSATAITKLPAFPQTSGELTKLPGVGPNTAGAIMAYGFNQPALSIETNIRTVYLLHFFQNQSAVDDKEILPLIRQTLDRTNPRKFYWALMDYGSWLKSSVGNANRASKHYSKQSKFQGSSRQIRGQVIRLLGMRPYHQNQLAAVITDARLPDILTGLKQEGLIKENQGRYSLE